MSKNGYYILKDYLDSLDSNKIDGFFKDVVGKSMDDIYGIGFKDLVRNKIIQICGRISYCYLLDENGDKIDSNLTLDEEMLANLNHCIQHNIEAIANAKDGANLAMDWKMGTNHNLTSANPLTNNERAIKDDISYNQLDIQIKQNKVIGEFIHTFEKMRDELKQFLEIFDVSVYYLD